MNSTNLLNTLSIALDTLNTNMAFLCFWVVLAWLILCANRILNNVLFVFGILPRHPIGLIGIFTSSLIHGNIQHLLMNSIFYLGLGGLVLSQGLDTFVVVTVAVILSSGSLVWALGRQALHIGASSLIIGYWAYLATRAIMDPSSVQILGALIGMYYFGIHMTGSLLSTEKNVSIEGHLAGLVSGLAVGYYYPELSALFNTYAVDLLDGAYSLSIMLNQLIANL